MINICFLIIFTIIAAKTVRTTTGELTKSGFQGFNVLIWIVAIWMICLIGLRVDYNDTAAYIDGFNNAETISELFSDSENLSWAKNPLFMLYTSYMRSITDNYHIYFMIPAAFIVVSFLKFFMQECETDILPYCLFLYFTFGTYFFSLAAMKQSIAMAILTYAIVALQRKKHLQFVVFVIVAGLFHTYAFLLILLLFFDSKPWKLRTFILIGATFVVMFTFENTLTTILQYADVIGKDIADEGLFNGAAMNTLRIAVYGVTPVLLFLGNRYLESEMERKHHILVHMSIFSFMFMLLGSISGANLFGRMARYFEVGTLVMLPWSVKRIFNERSTRFIYALMVVLFFVFFLYDYQGFDLSYKGITIFQFLKGVI